MTHAPRHFSFVHKIVSSLCNYTKLSWNMLNEIWPAGMSVGKTFMDLTVEIWARFYGNFEMSHDIMRFKIVCNFLKLAVFVNRSSRCRPSLCLSDVVCVAREFFSLMEQSTFCWQEAAQESSRFWWREACESIPTFHLFCLSCAMGKK